MKRIHDTAFRGLIKALLNIKQQYFTYASCIQNEQSEDDIEQRERVFAYELYHQWSKINRSKKLVLNGEIGKHLNNKYMYPDMVLHGGQDDFDHNEIVVEIKRASMVNDVNNGLKKDLEKLSLYLEDDETPDRKTHFRRYKFSVSIIYGVEMSNLKESIKNIAEDNTNNTNDKIVIIACPKEGVVQLLTIKEIIRVMNCQ